MAHWNEPFPRAYCISKEILHTEEEKVVNEVVEHLMNLLKGLSQEYIEEKALVYEERLEE